MKEEIIENLKELHREQGVLFQSEEDAIEYYRSLVELIEGLVMKFKLPNETKTKELSIEYCLRWLEKLETLTSKGAKLVHIKNLLLKEED